MILKLVNHTHACVDGDSDLMGTILTKMMMLSMTLKVSDFSFLDIRPVIFYQSFLKQKDINDP